MDGQPDNLANRGASGRLLPPGGDLARVLLALSQGQVEAAARGDWAAVGELLDRRAPLAAAVATIDPARLDRPARASLQAAVATVLDLDRRVVALAGATQADLQRELRRLRQGRQALRAYARLDPSRGLPR